MTINQKIFANFHSFRCLAAGAEDSPEKHRVIRVENVRRIGYEVEVEVE